MHKIRTFNGGFKNEFAAVRDEVKKQMHSMTQSFDTSLEKALTKQDRSISASIQELKLLMLEKANPAKKAKAGPSKTDGKDDDMDEAL